MTKEEFAAQEAVSSVTYRSADVYERATTPQCRLMVALAGTRVEFSHIDSYKEIVENGLSNFGAST